MSNQQYPHLEDIKKDLSNVTLYLMRKYPFYGILLKNLNIHYDPNTVGTPAYVHNLDLYLTKDFHLFNNQEKLYIIVHELNHILLKHSIRMKEYMRKYGIKGEYVPANLHLIINIALDSKANQYNMIQINTYNLKPVTLNDIARLLEYKYDVSTLEKMSSEEILELLLKKFSQQIASIGNLGNRCFIDVKENKPTKSVQIQKSSDEEKEKGVGEQENEQELEKKLTKKVLQAYTVAKSIGNLPGNIEELIENLLKPQVNWKILLRNAITKGLGRSVKRTWTRPSRKYELFPGKEILKINKVIVLMDVSGSISKEELQQFASEVYSIVKETSDVIVILWDADVQGEFILKRTSDVKKIKVTGRGGTLILPALQYAIKKYTGLYVILSDWEIGDLYNSNVKQLLQKIKPICITTHTIPKIEGLEKNFIKLKI